MDCLAVVVIFEELGGLMLARALVARLGSLHVIHRGMCPMQGPLSLQSHLSPPCLLPEAPV